MDGGFDPDAVTLPTGSYVDGAYVKGDGSWARVVRWLMEQGATRWTLPLP